MRKNVRQCLHVVTLPTSTQYMAEERNVTLAVNSILWSLWLAGDPQNGLVAHKAPFVSHKALAHSFLPSVMAINLEKM